MMCIEYDNRQQQPAGPPTITSPVLLKFGRRMQQSRTKQGISLKLLGNLTGIAPTHLALIELGQRNVTLVAMSIIATALGAEVKTLLE